MNKLAVVLGVAAVATFTGCKDPNYQGSHSVQEPKQLTTEPETVTPVKVIPEAPHCKCAPGTKHTAPCACGASDCTCVVEKPLPPAPPKPEVKPGEPEYTTYIVQNGDYLAKISKKYNVTIGSIKRINNLTSDKIRVGQKLKLPGKIDVGVQSAPAVKPTAGKSAAKPSSGKTTTKGVFKPYEGETKEYVVKAGDTLGVIAYANGISIRQLKKLNNLTKDSLQVGQKLKIPASVVKTATPNKTEPVKPSVDPAAQVGEPPKPATPPVAPQPPKEPSVETTPNAPVQPDVAVAKPVTTGDDAKDAANPTAAATTTYVVQEGEDLTRLSVDYGVTVSVIRELNGLSESDTIKPGQVLKLPSEAVNQ